VSAPESASNEASRDHTAVYRASTIKRQRRTRNELDQLDTQIVAVLRADHPQSVRFFTPASSALWSGIGGGELALAGFLCHRYANLALCPATPIGVEASGD
jgi:hypothetical protein